MKKQYFSPLVDRYFHQWIALSTWDSMHPADMERFYKFLKSVKRYFRKHWTTCFLQNVMEAAVEFHPDRDEKAVREAAIRFLEIADIVFSYEEASPFPDPLVEMRDPYQVSLYLSLLRVCDEQGGERYMYTLDEIEKILEENFGPGWSEHKGR